MEEYLEALIILLDGMQRDDAVMIELAAVKFTELTPMVCITKHERNVADILIEVLREEE